jgi:hypothetical protein
MVVLKHWSNCFTGSKWLLPKYNIDASDIRVEMIKKLTEANEVLKRI